VNGFSLHAATHVEAHDRDGLERLLRYGLRAPLSPKRLSLLPDGRVRYELRRPWPTPTGATALLFEPLQLMRRLASLIPRPYTNLVRYFGAFAGRSKYRPRLPLPPEAQAANAQARGTHASATADGPQLTLALDEETTDGSAEETPDGSAEEAPQVTLPVPRGPRAPWASLLMRAFGINPLHCACGATMTVLAMITAPHSLERILSYFDLPTHPPPIAPARLDPQTDLTLDALDELPPDDAYLDEPPAERHRHATSRAPP
jgi:hypothetical protein